MTVKAIFFDLDDTLFDCWGTLVEDAHRDAVRAMIKAGMPAEEEEALLRRLAIHDASPGCEIDRELAASYGAGESDGIVQAGHRAYHNRQVGEIKLFPGAREMIDRLRTGCMLFLVTVGGMRTQHEKVKQLSLKQTFHEIAYLDVEQGISKERAYRHLSGRYSLDPSECIAVGNRTDSDIRDANIVGMTTVLVQAGEYAKMAPAGEMDVPDYTVRSVIELEEIISKLAQ